MSDPILLPNAEERRLLLARATELVEAVFAGQPGWPVVDAGITPEAVRGRLAGYDFAEPRDGRAVLEDVFGLLRDYGLHVGHPGYYGLFNPTPAFMAVLADLLVAAFNPQLAAWHHNPAAVEIERHLVRYFAQAFGLPDTAYGHFTSGGSEANLSGVSVALARRYPQIASAGLRALERQPVMLASEESHHSLDKIAQQVGLGRAALIRVPVKGLAEGMDPTALAAMLERCRGDGLDPFLVVATAGTTNAGVIDPLRPIGELCRRENLHLHVDAAWGGPLILSERLRGRLDGIELADSITFDAHKLLSVPMAAGVFVCADKDWLTAAFDLDPAYVPRSAAAGMDNYRLSAQFSRRFIGLKLFMTLAAAGRDGMASTIERQVDNGRRLAVLLEADGWAVVNGDQPALVCFENPAWGGLERAERGRLYLAIAEAVVGGGGSWISVTRTVGRPVLRACITSYRTGETDLQRLVDALHKARGALGGDF